MGECRLGLYEKAMPAQLGWEERLEAAGAAGFDYVEMSIDETDARLSRLEWSDGQRRDCLRAVLDSGVPIHSMCLSGHRKYPLGSHDPAIRQRSLEILRRAVDLACALGIRIIQLAGYDVYYETGDALTRGYFEENLARSVEYAARNGVPLGFETMETPFLDTVRKGMRYVRGIHSPYLGMYPDLGNLTNAAKLYGGDWAEDLRSGTGSILALHLKETEVGKYRDMEFGAGHVDFACGIQTARALGVRMFVAEYWHHGSEHWRREIRGISIFLRRYLEP